MVDTPLYIPLTARINADTAVRVNFRYDPTDPWAVTLDVCGTPHAAETSALGMNWTRWYFSRDLLSGGVLAPSGEGNVRVFPDDVNATVWVELSSWCGHAYLVFERSDIEKALERSENLVEPGTEYRHVDWASEWQRLAATSSDAHRAEWGELR